MNKTYQKAVIKKILSEAEFPKNQKFNVVNKDGRLIVKLQSRRYERISNYKN
jgi:hypothetical protein